MNHKLLLVQGITLLYRESQITSVHEKSAELVRKIIGSIKAPAVAHAMDHEAALVEGLKALAQTMIDDPADHVYEPAELLQRVRVIAEDNDSIYDAIKAGITDEMKEGSLKRLCLNIKKSIASYFREVEGTDVLAKALAKLKFNRESIPDVKRFFGEIAASLEPYQADISTNDPAIVSCVDSEKPETLVEVFKSVKKDVDGTGIMVTGWQGFNRMVRGGLRRGETVVVGALQHNFKTGFMLSLFRHLCTYSTPELIDKSKKPMLLFISFENEMSTNWHLLYKSLKENETNITLTDDEIRNTPEEDIAGYIMNALSAKMGYRVVMLRVNPSMWTYMDICNKVIEYESDGYEIAALFVDYLAMIPTTGCRQGATGDDIRDLFRRMRNFCSARKILFATPHQLSADAKQLTRDGELDLVKKVANKGYYDGCKRLDQEVDLEIYIHIEIVNGKSYLTVQRGKHRTVVGQTPREHLYCVLPFAQVGAIRDDLLGPDTTCKKVGGGPIGSGQENPWWSTEAADSELF